MQYIKKIDNIERLYNVFIDKEKLTGLLNKIIKNVNYEIEGTYTLPYNARVDFKKKIIMSGANLPNGMPAFKNIKRIYPFASDDSYNYYNGSITVEATMIVAPHLAYLIKRILRNEINLIEKFLSYAYDDELISIDDRIIILDNQIKKMDSDNSIDKISLLKDYEKLLDDKKNNYYFDTQLLKEYYLEALSYISLQLVSEKRIITDGNKILLKDLK